MGARICAMCGADNGDYPYNVSVKCYMCGSLCVTRPSADGGEPETFAVRLGGYLPDPKSDAAKATGSLTVDKLPRRVDLRPGCTAVEDQATIGSCTANAAVGALEFHRKRLGLTPSDLSRLFVYFNARQLRGDTENDTGATIAECMAAVMAYGAPDAALWPYDVNRWREKPPQEVYQAAQFNEAVEYARVSPRDGVFNALALGFPVSFGCFLPASAYQSASASGEMAPPTEQQWLTEEKGGHAMLVVGYDLDREIYIVRNSWGAAYGDGGYIYIPFQVMDRGAHAESFWIIGKLEQEAGLRIDRPESSAARGDAAASASAGLSDAVKSLRDEIRGDLEAGVSDLRKGLRDRLKK